MSNVENTKNILKSLQYDLLDYIEGEIESEEEPSYSADDVTSCIKSLLDFLSVIESEEQTIVSAREHVHQLVLSLNELNHECGGHLIETGQREDICEFIDKVLSSAEIEFEGDITEDWREW